MIDKAKALRVSTASDKQKTVTRYKTESSLKPAPVTKTYKLPEKKEPLNQKPNTQEKKKALTVDTDLYEEESNPKQNFTIVNEKVIGGTFGIIYQARILETDEIVAVKKVFQDERFKNRELQIMQELDHCNIIKLIHHFFSQSEEPDAVFLNLVTEFIPENLQRVSKFYISKQQSVPNILIKLYSYQILRSLAYLHGLGICHRDVKPQNILVDPSTHVVRLCDFGCAKRLLPGESSVSYISSRHYRAPELIFGATEYSTSIDLWSVGCIIAEMILGEVIFPGESSLDQLIEIMKLLGTPSEDEVLDMNQNLEGFVCPKLRSTPWTKVFPSYSDPFAIDLVSKLLVYSPEQRLKPVEALLHPYFDELRNKNTKINGNTLPELFNFHPEEIYTHPDLIDKLIPSWYKPTRN